MYGRRFVELIIRDVSCLLILACVDRVLENEERVREGVREREREPRDEDI